MLIGEFTTGLSMPWSIAMARLAGAVLLCGLIGLEREVSSHSAGLRTHMLLGLAAATFTLITLHLVEVYGTRPGVQVDPIRLVEAATSGVAFLAAGMIVLSRGRVRNLTTGAVMWLASGTGVACGLGLWPLAAASALLGTLVLRLRPDAIPDTGRDPDG